MPVLSLDHVNIRAADPARTVAFFRDVLQMKVGAPPGSAAAGNGGWVYDARDLPVIHIGSSDAVYPSDPDRPFSPATGSGAIHHVALRCSAFEETRARLKASGIPFSENDVPRLGLRQIFVSEPADILLELNFPAD